MDSLLSSFGLTKSSSSPFGTSIWFSSGGFLFSVHCFFPMATFWPLQGEIICFNASNEMAAEPKMHLVSMAENDIQEGHMVPDYTFRETSMHVSWQSCGPVNTFSLSSLLDPKALKRPIHRGFMLQSESFLTQSFQNEWHYPYLLSISTQMKPTKKLSFKAGNSPGKVGLPIQDQRCHASHRYKQRNLNNGNEDQVLWRQQCACPWQRISNGELHHKSGEQHWDQGFEAVCEIGLSDEEAGEADEGQHDGWHYGLESEEQPARKMTINKILQIRAQASS